MLPGVESSDQTVRPALMMLYGSGGAGKTTFALKAPSPILIGEDGTDWFKLDRFPVPKTYKEMMGYLKTLMEHSHEYQTLIFDGVSTVLEPLLHKHIAEQRKVESIESVGFGKGYQYSDELFTKELVPVFDMLRNQKKMHIILIAHAEKKKDFNADVQADLVRYDIQVRPGLKKILTGYMDGIYFVSKEMSCTETEGKRKAAFMTGKRYLFPEEDGAFYAKNRFNLKQPLDLDMSWEQFAKHCQIIYPAVWTNEEAREKALALANRLPEQLREKALGHIEKHPENFWALVKAIDAATNILKKGNQ